jgi:hypothetical protein
MTCSGGSEDTTYVTRTRDTIVVVAHKAGRNPRQSPNQVHVCGECNKVENLSCLLDGSLNYISSNPQLIRGNQFSTP